MVLHKHSNFVSSVSPDGKELVSFDTSNNQLQTWQLSKNGLRSKDHDWQQDDHFHLSFATNSTSIAISNRGEDDEIYIAISRICDKDIQVEEKEEKEEKVKTRSVDDLQQISVDSGCDGTLFTPSTFTPSFTPTTSTPTSTYYDTSSTSSTADFSQEEQAIIIIHINKADQTKRIESGLKGGIVKFINSNTLIILRGNEFIRVNFDNENFLSESFSHPESTINELKMRSSKSSKALLDSTIIKNYFFLSKSTQQNIIFEMYGLEDLELKHVFHLKRTSADNSGCEHINDEGVRTPLFAMSENGKLLAASLCKQVVTIFLIENSLMVANCSFRKSTCNSTKSAKILDMKFFDNDNKLVILTQERDGVYTTIWDLFNCNTHSPYITHLDPSTSLDEPIDRGMRKSIQICGRPLGIFSNYLIYPAQLTQLTKESSTGVNLVPFKEKYCENKYEKYETIVDSSEKDFYNEHNSNQKIRYKIFDCNGKRLPDDNDLIIEDSEPWNSTHNKLQVVVWLDSKKTIQLIIGKESIQVWEQNKKLIYIWTPLLFEVYHLESDISHCFVLKKYSKHQYQYKMTFSFGPKEFCIYLPREKDYIKSACNAVEFLGWKMKHTKYLDNKLRRYLNKTIQETRLLIKKFISEQPQTWKLLDIKECTMSHLVAARCDDLISYIVDEKRDLKLHTPRRYAWSESELEECNGLLTNGEEKPEKPTEVLKRGILQILQRKKFAVKKTDYLRKPSDLKIAINRTNKNAVKGLVNYYSTLSMNNNVGWMFTVSDELLDLLQYNSEYVVELFYQPIFGAMEVLHLNKSRITSEISLPGSKNSTHALYDVPNKLIESPNTTKSQKNKPLDSAPWVKTCIVPLPDITVPKNGFQQSTFTQMVSISLSSNDDLDFIFDNPAVEAIINFKWFKYAKKRIYFLLVLYAFYQLCFGFLCLAYIRSWFLTSWIWVILPSAFWTLLFGGFLLISEANQVLFLKLKYVRIYNIFDLLSCILPLICTALLLKFSLDEWKTGQKEKISEQVLILLSITMLTLWLQLLMKLRSLPIIGEYVFIIINLSKRIAPFLLAMLVIICGLAHSMFILLSNPNEIERTPSLSKYTFFNQKTQEKYILTEEIDVDDKYDNFYSDIFTSIKAVYFWINGQWDQISLWQEFWPVVGLSIFGSLFLVIIMQNILIALMSDVVDEAKEIGKRAFLKLRAELISEVEIFYLSKKQLQDKDLFPRYIYYIINCDEARHWLEKCKKRNSVNYGEVKDKKIKERDSLKRKEEESFSKMEKIYEDKENSNMASHSLVTNKHNNSTGNNITNDGNNGIKEDNSSSPEDKDSGMEEKIAEIERNIKSLLELARNNK